MNAQTEYLICGLPPEFHSSPCPYIAVLVLHSWLRPVPATLPHNHDYGFDGIDNKDKLICMQPNLRMPTNLKFVISYKRKSTPFQYVDGYVFPDIFVLIDQWCEVTQHCQFLWALPQFPRKHQQKWLTVLLCRTEWDCLFKFIKKASKVRVLVKYIWGRYKLSWNVVNMEEEEGRGVVVEEIAEAQRQP